MSNLESQLAKIVADIFTTFPDGPPPVLDRESEVPEVAAAATATLGSSWKTASTDVLNTVHDALPWLDAASFAYWLPALLVDLLVDPSRAELYGDALIFALTPPAATDLATDLRALDSARERGFLQGATYDSAAKKVFTWHQHRRAARFEARWTQLNASRQTAVLDALVYLAQWQTRKDAAEAVRRLRDLRIN